MLTDFYASLFRDLEQVQLPAWIHKVWDSDALESLPRLDGKLVRELLLEMSNGKTCASDLLVVEMLKELDADLLEVLASVFRSRLLNNQASSNDESWDQHLVRLLKKKDFKNRVHQFRPITVLPVLYKVYSRCLLALTDGCMNKLTAAQFAFRANFQGHEVIHILRSLAEKALEWGTTLCVLDGDIEKAYDNTRHNMIIS
eukprot:3142199-Karenia_brevis.AAC.1